MPTIAVVDYGMGNLHSIAKAMERVVGDERIEVTYDLERLKKADKLVLPGVGSIRDCVTELQRLEIDETVCELARNKPMLGICLGMQVLLDSSEENGGVSGLGLVPGKVSRFPAPAVVAEASAPVGPRLKVPHMGWNQVSQVKDHPIWRGIADQSRFYFVHSYHVQPQASDAVLGQTEHGLAFCSALAHENIVATQFHPEKSQQNGLALLANFVNWDGQF